MMMMMRMMKFDVYAAEREAETSLGFLATMETGKAV